MREQAPVVTTNDISTRSSDSGGCVGGGLQEVPIQKSPAEFFAENQAIAGFDNLGKSLYTTIRELIENSLDACEVIQQLPYIAVHVQEYTQQQFNALSMDDVRLNTSSSIPNSISNNDYYSASSFSKQQQQQQIDTKLFEKKGSRKRALNKDSIVCDAMDYQNETDVVVEEEDVKKSKKTTTKDSNSKMNQYYLITVTDNGCGMEHTAIPDMFGRVLSGSKYGVRQTRGKYGLGGKMALIWSKKSTGHHPIHIKTAHEPQPNRTNGVDRSKRIPSTHISSCILDIDIHKNEPRVIEHTKSLNTTNYVGSTVRVLIAGNWSTYKSRIIQYLEQLAIITPYAELSLTYTETSGNKRDVHLLYHRRSEQMPDIPTTVKYHPASVNNVIVQQLLHQTRTTSLVSFLSKELQAISVPLAKRLIAELEESAGFLENLKPKHLSNQQITRMVQLFHQVQLFRPPDGACLSPLGEYNLNLGIQKVLEPDYVATTRDKVSVYEGHPFLIEAAVSLGGLKAKEGITVYRFANRIPLLFEGGADVATRVAMTKIKWSNYKIDYKRDKVGVFVSIVSTKIPFKGTSKEYIGDDGTCSKFNLSTTGVHLDSLLIHLSMFRLTKRRKSISL
jgi:DNA topoisomerase VI subunit B